MTKEELRKEILDMMRTLNPTKQESENTVENLCILEELRKAKTVLAFEPMLKSEVDIRPLFTQLGGFFRKVYVPELVSETDMVFVTRDSLVGGRFFSAGDRMPEPVAVLVPGLAFTANGSRLGRGRGYYDRFLTKMSESGTRFISIGVCAQRQIREEIPTDEKDAGVDIVVTDKNTYRCRSVQ